MDLIRDVAIRRMLIRYYRHYEQNAQWQGTHSGIQLRYFELQSGILEEHQYFSIGERANAVTVQDAMQVLERMKTHQQFRDWLPRITRMNKSIIFVYQGMLKQTNELRMALEEEEKGISPDI